MLPAVQQIMAAAMAMSVLSVSSALAACPQALAVYKGKDGVGELDFHGGNGALSEVRVLYAGVAPITAYLGQDDRLGRTEIMIPLNCPEGDVTGEELDACLIYQGAVYSLGKAGDIASLAGQGDAADTLFLPNLAAAIWDNPQFDGKGPKERPAEIFELSGCQE